MTQAIDEDSFGLEPGAKLERIEILTDYRDPFRFQKEDHLKGMMLETLMHGVSDIFIQPGLPVCVKKFGRLLAVTRRGLDAGEVIEILKWVCNRDTAATDIISGRPINERYELFDPTRKDSRGARVRYAYRVNASPIAHLGGTSCQIVIRAIPDDPPLHTDVGLTEDVVRMAIPKDGIVYVSGSTGEGKSTTMAAILRFILENDTPAAGNMLTHEQPIEYTFTNILSRHSILVQSAIPDHFKDFYAANGEAMRRAPGLVSIGELRDEQTIRAAIELANTGHPVYGTVHSKDVPAIMRRMISRFPENERASAIFDLVDTARFMMAQRLLPSIQGGRVAARSYLHFTADMRDDLMNLTDMGRVTQAVSALLQERGHTFDAEADRLLGAGLIDKKTANTLRRDGGY